MNMDKLAELVDKCASTRGAPAAAELFQHIAQLLSEDVERDSRPELRSALFRVARAGAAARSNNPRAALALLDGAWLRCRDERDRATLLAEAERLHAAAVASTTFEAAALDACSCIVGAQRGKFSGTCGRRPLPGHPLPRHENPWAGLAVGHS